MAHWVALSPHSKEGLGSGPSWGVCVGFVRVIWLSSHHPGELKMLNCPLGVSENVCLSFRYEVVVLVL